MKKSVLTTSTLILLSFILIKSIYGATIGVNNEDDSGPGSLRWAVDHAENDDIITIDVVSIPRIDLTSGPLIIDDRISIIGNTRTTQFGVSRVILSATDLSNFITISDIPYDWALYTWTTRWSVEGIKTPADVCPEGWRVPTQKEWETALAAFSSNDALGAFSSPLKLTLAGIRWRNGGLVFDNEIGKYWSSTPLSSRVSKALHIENYSADMDNYMRSHGCSVRCVRE